jgi:hypothetical protein
MKKQIALIVALSLLGTVASAQEKADKESITAVIHALFKGMEKGDSALVHSAFADEITMATAFRDKNNMAVLRRESSLDDFLKAVGTAHTEIWYEEIWDLKIQIDGDFAQAWCDYAFYRDNTFSHCGIDAFHLHKGKDGWKIFHLADTRRKTDCLIPKNIQQKHK